MKLPNASGVIVHADLDELSAAVAQRIAILARASIMERGVFRMALAGGETPRRCYEHLRRMPIEWDRIEFYFGDERCLPLGDVQRNDSMAYDALLKYVPILQGSVRAIPAEEGARVAAEEYAKMLNLPLDLVLLGMGEDGHTASLFPGHPAADSAASVVAVFDSPKPPPERVSLSMTTLNAARVKMFLVAGAGKRDALQRIAQGVQLPAGRIVGAEWHVDKAVWPD